MGCAMIDDIHVENLALIPEAELEPGSGLTVLTGETGAGKSALLSALKLLMGERADSSQVRDGEDNATVEGRFFVDDADAEGFTVRRTLSADGRSRVRIDGRLASVRELAERVGPLVDLCGQHEHQRLLDAATHVELVDAWAGAEVSEALDEYRRALAAARARARELARIEDAAKAEGKRVDEARFCVDRFDEIAPEAGEYEHLEEVLPRAEHAEALATCAYEAKESLSGENGALDTLNAAAFELARMGSVDEKLQKIAVELNEAIIVAEDASAELARYREEIEFDPGELEQLQTRFSDLKGLLRLFGPTMDDVFAAKDAAEQLLSVVDHSEAQIARAQKELEQAENDLAHAAKKLARARASAAPRFCAAVAREMGRLEMSGAELVWEARDLPRKSWNESGSQACELLYRGGAALTPRPLRRIASGGELSRVMLACKVVLGARDTARTLVFDEVDAGVGGATARSLASVLADLAKTHQVIVVTHLAQVAVVATTHYMVKKSSGERPETALIELTGDARAEEIARMLSGDDSEVALEHARAMLEENATGR